MNNTIVQKEQICEYWSKRSKDFASLRQEEIESYLAELWVGEITKYFPSNKKLNILDVGTGSGFFAILLSKLGHNVIGIDLSESMIAEAKKLADKNNAKAEFYTMDAENLGFEDCTFDAIVSRNVIWTLPNPDNAYTHWVRVLKHGGTILNFDADYSEKEDSESEKNLPKDHAHVNMDKDLAEEWKAINESLPLAGKRPEWDEAFLTKLGCNDICVDKTISQKMYAKINKFYNPTPMFLIKAIKSPN